MIFKNCYTLLKTRAIKYFCLSFLFVFFISCSVSKRYIITSPYSESAVPPIPDYSKNSSWASLPTMKDEADEMPDKNLKYGQDSAKVDVFFIHPTIFTDEPEGEFKWNADINDKKLNKKVDNSTIKLQTSVFNVSCRIYAPRYRQAHISAFYTKDLDAKRKSLDTAYADVKSAFEYYLQHYNNGRPIIIAGHSQGTKHAARLLKEFFDDKPLHKQLVCAYLIGMPVPTDSFCCISPCEDSTQTDCWISWNTLAYGFTPPYYQYGLNHAVCTNPLTWRIDSLYAGNNCNEGGVLKNIHHLYPGICDVQVHEGMLWINKPVFRGSNLFDWKIYHVLDYGLFYMNIRKNVEQRCTAYLSGKK
ncbi:MAG: DUF3089 domain-containing protein [Bacteroidota bacterium]